MSLWGSLKGTGSGTGELALLGKVEEAVFIECFMKWEMPEQVSQQFLASQDGKVVPV